MSDEQNKEQDKELEDELSDKEKKARDDRKVAKREGPLRSAGVRKEG